MKTIHINYVLELDEEDDWKQDFPDKTELENYVLELGEKFHKYLRCYTFDQSLEIKYVEE